MAQANQHVSLVDSVPNLVNAPPLAAHVDTPTTHGLLWLHWLAGVVCALATLVILTLDKTLASTAPTAP